MNEDWCKSAPIQTDTRTYYRALWCNTPIGRGATGKPTVYTAAEPVECLTAAKAVDLVAAHASQHKRHRPPEGYNIERVTVERRLSVTEEIISRETL